MKANGFSEESFGTEGIWRILIHLAPPVMLAQLIQALYNIVDSFFVGKFSDDALTALTVIYPYQLLLIAFAVGTGVGVNALMAKRYAEGDEKAADAAGGAGVLLALLSWAIFAVLSVFLVEPFVKLSTKTDAVIKDATVYGLIVSVGSAGLFTESCFSKIHQARGNMLVPTIAQIAGAAVNIILDPILIFGWGPVKEFGVAGAAIATVAGQVVAAAITGVKGFRMPPAFGKMSKIVKDIYKFAYPSILMQALYFVYIQTLNVVLKKFGDPAVTVLGLYYKWQSLFFIPLFALQTCIVPVLSYNYTRKNYSRCKAVVADTVIVSAVFMILGVFCFEVLPVPLIKLFSGGEEVIKIGKVAFRIIGLSFIPDALSFNAPIVFQATGKSGKSAFLSLLRQIFLLIPVFFLFSLIGVNYVWIAFPVAEIVTGLAGLLMFKKETETWI